MTIKYCGYCGEYFEGELEEICDDCYGNPGTRADYEEAAMWDRAEEEHNLDYEEEILKDWEERDNEG